MLLDLSKSLLINTSTVLMLHNVIVKKSLCNILTMRQFTKLSAGPLRVTSLVVKLKGALHGEREKDIL